jgi:hypothetical protein
LNEDEHRYRCLVRWVIKKRIEDRDGAYRWLKGYVDKYGQRIKGWNDLHPKSRLEADVRLEWSLGNRGEDGDWRQDKKEST